MMAPSETLSLPPVVAGPPITISASTYVQYLRCPEQAAARIRGIFPEDTRASFKGGLAHRVFARHLERGEIAATDLDQVCREEIGQAMNQKLAALRMRPPELWGVIREVGELYERFKRFPADGFAGAEVQIEAQPWHGVTLRGVVDAIFDDGGEVRLVDWKTGWIGEAAHQMDFYALLWWLDRSEVPVRIEAVSVQTGEQVASAPVLDDVARTLVAVAGIVSTVRSSFSAGDPLDRNAGPWCRFCPVVGQCPEGAAAAAIGSAS
jgi:hypothetical protein